MSVQIREQTLYLGGIDDPTAFPEPSNPKTMRPQWLQQLQACRPETEELFSILLSHRPHYVEIYEDSGFDLILSGHAHGGQVRIPGVLNGLLAPDQGLLPKYAGGLYDLGTASLIVSRGLCRNYLPRVFNPPELVIVDLVPESA